MTVLTAFERGQRVDIVCVALVRVRMAVAMIAPGLPEGRQRFQTMRVQTTQRGQQRAQQYNEHDPQPQAAAQPVPPTDGCQEGTHF